MCSVESNKVESFSSQERTVLHRLVELVPGPLNLSLHVLNERITRIPPAVGIGFPRLQARDLVSPASRFPDTACNLRPAGNTSSTST